MNVNDMVHLFNKTIKNILGNLIPHKTITCDDRDPPWINSSIRCLIQDKNEAYKRFKRSNNSNQYFENFQSLQNLLGVSIEASKEIYYSRLSRLFINGTIHKSQNILAIHQPTYFRHSRNIQII